MHVQRFHPITQKPLNTVQFGGLRDHLPFFKKTESIPDLGAAQAVTEEFLKAKDNYELQSPDPKNLDALSRIEIKRIRDGECITKGSFTLVPKPGVSSNIQALKYNISYTTVDFKPHAAKEKLVIERSDKKYVYELKYAYGYQPVLDKLNLMLRDLVETQKVQVQHALQNHHQIVEQRRKAALEKQTETILNEIQF